MTYYDPRRFGESYPPTTYDNTLPQSEMTKIHWSMLLTTHQCTSTEELIICGIPLAKDENYKNACLYGSAEENMLYAEIAEATLLATQSQIYRYAVEIPDAYLANKWIEHYSKAVCLDESTGKVYQYLLENAGNKEPCSYFPGLLVAFYRCYEEKVTQFKNKCKNQELKAFIEDLSKTFTRKIKDKFIAQMDLLCAQIAKPIAATVVSQEATGPALFPDTARYKSYIEEMQTMLEKSGLKFKCCTNEERLAADAAAAIWTDPCGEYNKLTGSCFTMPDFDKCGTTKGERWLALGKKLWESPHKPTLTVYEYILKLTANAESMGADINRVNTIRNKIIKDILAREDLTEEELKCVLEFCPQDAAAYWKLLSIKTKNFTTTTLKDYTKYNLVYKNIEEKRKKKLSLDQLKKDLSQLEGNLKELNKQETELSEACQLVAQQAMQYATGQQVKDYRSQWEAYLQKANADFSRMREDISHKIAYYERVAGRLEKRGKIFSATIIALLLISSLCVLFLLSRG